MEQQKIKMSQDELYQYLNDHDVKVIRLAELMGKTPAVIISNFRHHANAHGNPRRFSVENCRQLTEALHVIASELRGCVMKFGTEETYTNTHGRTYDPGMIKPINRVGELMNLTQLAERLLGWNKGKRTSVLSDTNSKAYGNVSKSDVLLINIEIASVAGVLDLVEVVPDKEAFDGGSSDAEENNN